MTFIIGKTEVLIDEIIFDDGKSTVKNLEFMSWIRTNRLVKARITSTRYKDVLNLVVGLETYVDV